MFSTWNDLRHVVRALRSAPGFSAAVVLTLALGIGANTSVFSLVNAVVIRPLPYRLPQRLAAIYETEPDLPKAAFSLPDLIDWRDRNQSFEAISSFQPDDVVLTGEARPERLPILRVTSDFLQTLGTSPGIGRDFLAEEMLPGKGNVVILTAGFALRRFGKTDVLGRKLLLDGVPHMVVGVLPREVRLILRRPYPVEALLPMPLPRNAGDRGTHDRFAIGRLRKGVTLRAAQRDLSAVARQIAAEHPKTNVTVGAKLLPLQDDIVGRYNQLMAALAGSVMLLLLMACVNVTSLFLARGLARQKELAVRVSLGASRIRIIRRLLIESVLLSLAGGAAGIALAVGGTHFLKSAKALGVPRLAEVNVDSGVLMYCFFISVAVGIVSGIIPALGQSFKDLHLQIGESGIRTATGGKRAGRLRAVLVASELAFAVILLIGAGLMIRTMIRLAAIDPGFRPAHVITAQLSISQSRYTKYEKLAAFARSLTDKVRALPGVAEASITNKIPLRGGWNGTIIVEGKPYTQNEFEGPLVEYSYVLPKYFQTMGIPLLAGRDFHESDIKEKPDTVIVNQTFAHRLLPNEDPIGKRISEERNPPHWLEIVGLVGDTPQLGLSQPAYPEIYQPVAQPYMVLVVRTRTDPESIVEPVQTALASIDSEVAMSEVHTMDEVLETSSAGTKFYTRLVALFAAVALTLAAVGIYGLVSFLVSLRRREIAIRLALGATSGRVVRTALMKTVWLTLAAALSGIAVAFVLTRYIGSLLYGISATDPIAFAGSPLLLALVAGTASLIPTIRVARRQPAAMLRSD